MTPQEEQAERELIVRKLDMLLAVAAVELSAQERKEQAREERDRQHPYAGDWRKKAS